jgi:hypothetical protein
MNKEQALNYVSDKSNYKNFKEFLIRDYFSYKIFEIIPTLIKKCKDEYLDDELDNDFDDIKLEDNYNNNNNKINGDEIPGKIFNEEDFQGSEMDGYYSEQDADNHKQIIREKNSDKKNKNNNYNFNNNLSNKKNNENKDALISVGKNKSISKNIGFYEQDEEKENNLNYNKNNDWEFPVILGSFQNFQNVSLEYIKFLTEVLAIDPDLSDVAYKLKKNSLKLINIEEFSKETNFIEPCRTFILHDVVCELCSTNKDFDFCRDSTILSNEWKCELCNTSFDREFIEFLIIQKVRSFIDYYFNQDLKCSKCLMQKNELIFTRCECAGDFLKTYEENFFEKISGNNIKSMDEFLEVVFNIANYYQFINLRALLEQVNFHSYNANPNLSYYFN